MSKLIGVSCWGCSKQIDNPSKLTKFCSDCIKIRNTSPKPSKVTQWATKNVIIRAFVELEGISIKRKKKILNAVLYPKKYKTIVTEDGERWSSVEIPYTKRANWKTDIEKIVLGGKSNA